MKGLEKYLAKYGYHFTEELAEKVIPQKWSSRDIMDSAQKRVYYNVTGATDGDMVYIVHWIYKKEGWPMTDTKKGCISSMLFIIGSGEADSIGDPSSYFFCSWLHNTAKDKKDFDFTPYI